MIQAARSGKQNILEGSKASRTSTEMEIKLTNTARASLEELLDDYHDFIRARKLSLWGKDSREAKFVRNLGANPEVACAQYREFCETRPPEVVANIAICLIHQTNYLLDQQMRRLERDFMKDGGFRERMRRARLEQRCQNAKHRPRSSKNDRPSTTYKSCGSYKSYSLGCPAAHAHSSLAPSL
jgi:four helix bundle suffix protein